MSRSAAWLAVLLAFGCAAMQDNRPVGTTGTPTGPVQVTGSERGVIPVGQEIDVRTQDLLSSRTAREEQRFTTTTVVDLKQGDRILIPAGSVVRGVVRSVKPAGRIDRTGSLSLAFDRLIVNGREYDIRALATQVYEGRVAQEAAKVGTAGAVGAIVGGIIGGARGALIGATVGGGGVVAATQGDDVEIPPGSIIRIRLDSPVELG